MSDLGHVLILAGGLSAEREVSLRSGDRVRDALAEAGIDAVVADADSDLLTRLRADPPSAVFPVIHGASGEAFSGKAPVRNSTIYAFCSYSSRAAADSVR